MDEQDAARRADNRIDRLVEPLKTNMPEAGDFGFRAIQQLGNAVPMLVQNSAAEQLQLWLEPFGQNH